MPAFVPLATWPDRLRAVAVLGGIAAISVLHVLTPGPATSADHMAAHGLHSALEGLYYIPLLLAGYWWGGWPAGLCGLLVSAVYGVHTEAQLGGVLLAANRGRLLALFIFPAVALATGLLADRLRRETRSLLEAERQLRRAEMLAALGELSAGLAHEVRNPLAAIRGAADVLAAGVPKGSRDEEFARLLLSEVRRLDRVVSDFLLFARPGKPGEEFADPALCAKATFTLLRPQAEKAGVDLRLHGGGIDRLVRCPPESLRQVLLNLCLNALQAIGERPGAVTVRITEPERGRVRIVVDDTGPGVPADQREAIFRPFHTTRERGTGLGLSVVAKVAAGCGGAVAVGEAEGGGARFTVDLPAAPAGTPAPVPEVVG
jgi:signal transduction histidine kinase